VRLEATESELFHPSTVSFLKDYAFTSVNMSSRMDMPDNFATDSHPASLFGRRPIVVRFVESLKLPYIDGLEHVLKERKLGLWDRLVSLTPKATLRRLFTDVKPDTLHHLIDRQKVEQ